MYYKKQPVRKPNENKSEFIFGVRAVLEAIHAGKDMDKILVRKDADSELIKELLDAVKGLRIPIQRVPVEKLNRVTMKNQQGVVAFLSEVTYQKLEDLIPQWYEEGKDPFVVLLDGITDVRNFGAIARTCECAGVNAIVLPQSGSAPVNADAIKTSAGALMSIPVCREHNLAYVLQFMKDSGIKLIAASEKAAKDYTLLSYTEPTAIVMGAEDIGISQSNLALCDESARIPILGEIASLNVSVAAGI